MGHGGLKIAGCVVCSIIVIVIIILVSLSFSSLEPNEVGLDYSANSLTISSNNGELYTAGRTFLGVGHSFLKFPKAVLEIDMRSPSEAIQARTRDGLKITLMTRMFYRLTISANRLAALYLSLKEDYPAAFKSLARGTIRDVASNFTAFEFWAIRDLITTAMKLELSRKLADVSCEVGDFLLSDFVLPVAFQGALTETDVASQELQQVSYETQKVTTEIATRQKAAEQQVFQIDIEAARTAETLLLEYRAKANLLTEAINAEYEAYGALKTQLSLTEQELADMVWVLGLKKSPSVSKTFQVPLPKSLQ
jgi:hypothetical protein